MKKILVLGDIFLDIFQVTKTEKISPERPVPVLKPVKDILLLGGAANVANNLKSVGGSPFLITKLSKNFVQKNIYQLLKKNKIDFKIFINKNYSTPVKKRIVENDHQFCRIDDEKISKLTTIDEKKIIKFIKKNINTFDSLILSDYAKGFLTPSLIKKVIEIFNKNKKKVFTDPKNKNVSIYKKSNYICPNLKEFEEFFDYQNTNINKKSLLKLFNRASNEAFIVTKGSSGTEIIYRNGLKIKIPQKSVNVYDVTGAGDTFIALFSFLISNNIDIINALKISSFACTKIVQKKYTSVLEFAEFQNVILEFCKNNLLDLHFKVKLWKLARLKIGIANGCFDVLHSGHLYLFSKSKMECDKLIVLTNTDNSIRAIKGKGRPKLKMKTRIKFLKMIKDIDEVVTFNDKTPIKLIKKIMPNVIFKGSDYKKKEVIGYEEIIKNGGSIKIIKNLKDFSSSKLIEK